MIISSCVHSNRVETKYIYTDEYIDFILKKILYDIKIGSEQDIMDNFFEYLNINDIKVTNLKKRLFELFGKKDKGKYYLNESIKNEMLQYQLLKKRFDEIYCLESFLLMSSLDINVDNFDKFYDSIIIFHSLKSKEYNYDKNETLIYIHNFINNFELRICNLSEKKEKIRKSYYSLSIYDFFEFDDIEKRLFIKNSINTIADLIKLNNYFLMYMMSSNFDNYIKQFDSLCISIKNVINGAFQNIDEKNLEIVIKRNGYISGHKYTLEEIGHESSVTRERIRQLESKTIKYIKKISKANFNALLSFYNSELGHKNPYITLDSLANKYDELFIQKILLLLEFGTNHIIYDSEYQIIYDKKTNSIDLMKDDVINKIGIVAEPTELEKCNLFEINVIKKNYKEISNNLFLKNGCIYRDLFLELIEELFPKGYKSGSDDNYNTFVQSVKDRYKLEKSIPSKHSLEAMIGRSNFIQSDRGEYISEKFAVDLEPQMVDKILNYISENEFTYYNAIFEKFSNELIKQGIKNRYYLKGCIDKYLADDMSTKRDYIICGDTNKTPYDIVLNQLHTFEGKFTKKDLKNIFVGIKDYTISNLLYNEVDKGLIWISSNDFIYSDKYNMDIKLKEELRDFINELFKSLNTKLLTSKKIYAKLQLTRRDLFEKLNLTNGHFELFSIIKSEYVEFYYSRPYIFIDENEYYTRSSIVQNYVRQFDLFNIKMIQDYQSNLNIGGLHSYLEFMENMSDEYVQVDIDEMVKIEKLNINSVTLNEIKKTIDLILENFEIIETSKFNGYSLLPKISYVWNKYLLVGIIRSYLSEYYDIKNTESTYTNTDFEVRRVNYEY